MKLLLADDHTLFKDALVQYIVRADPDAKVSLAKDLPEAIVIMENDPDHDLILLDLKMPGMHGMEGLKQVREKFPDVPVALITGVAEKEDVDAAMELGAIGYFPKTLSGKALLKAIQFVLTGEKFIPLDHHTNSIMPAYRDDGNHMESSSTAKHNAKNIKLTPRELEVLSYLAKGESNKEIANALGLQVVTVKLHVRGICQKLEAKNRTQAALKAREFGLCS
ncbi:MAG: response regulator transcription factor [Alphaproteobacteria bacterium]|nr:response regulator transcription factor [Alphaproteobacteria bacterium]